MAAGASIGCAPPLEARGHVVAAPDAAGAWAATRSQLAAMRAGGLGRVRRAAGARRCRSPVILCGHSRAGIGDQPAAERDPDAFAALGLYRRRLPRAGRASPCVSRRAKACRAIRTSRDGRSTRRGGAGACDLRARGGDPRVSTATVRRPDQDGSAARLVPEPIAPAGGAAALSDARYGRCRATMSNARRTAAIPIAQQRACRPLPCASVTTLESDHSPIRLACRSGWRQSLHKHCRGFEQ